MLNKEKLEQLMAILGELTEEQKAILDRYHSRSEHKRQPISTFVNSKESK